MSVSSIDLTPTVISVQDTESALRLCMESARNDFEIEPATLAAARAAFSVEQANALSRDTVREIFEGVVTGEKPSRGFVALSEIGALAWMLPELAQGENLSQNRFHKHDIFFHSVYACDAVEEPNLPLRLAALLHDIGKSTTRRVAEDGEASFHNHEVVGARQTARILKRFGFDADLIGKVTFLVRNHMFHYTPEWTDQAVRRFVKRVSPDQMNDLIALRIADRKGSGKRATIPKPIFDFLEHMKRIREEENELKVRDLAIGGAELSELGLKPGPLMGDLLKLLLAQVKSGHLANERTALEAVVRSELGVRGL
ncbi:MAG: HD domain-containing protein [Spirochaetia bacterium]|nr:HD domain-containing protein [Spirochaetia bacterium]